MVHFVVNLPTDHSLRRYKIGDDLCLTSTCISLISYQYKDFEFIGLVIFGLWHVLVKYLTHWIFTGDRPLNSYF